MYCKNCGAALADGATACDYCGQAVPSQSDAETTAAQTQQDAYTQTENLQEGAAYQQTNTIPVQTAVAPAKRENVVTGIVGALIGAAIGAAVIILLSQLGFVASISGLILAVCTLKGYELLGHQLSIKGAIICLILILVTPYLADRLDWAMIIKESWGDISLGEAFAIVPEVIALDAELKAEYIKCLVLLYVFAGIGAFSTVRDLFRK